MRNVLITATLQVRVVIVLTAVVLLTAAVALEVQAFRVQVVVAAAQVVAAVVSAVEVHQEEVLQVAHAVVVQDDNFKKILL